jgi:hypothetical protein
MPITPAATVTQTSFTVGMGAPLSPGTYYIGVYNYSQLYPADYRLVSRGIGTTDTLDAAGNPWLIPVQTLGFSQSTSGSILPTPQGDSDGIQDLRDIAVYRITVPDSVSACDVGYKTWPFAQYQGE